MGRPFGCIPRTGHINLNAYPHGEINHIEVGENLTAKINPIKLDTNVIKVEVLYSKNRFMGTREIESRNANIVAQKKLTTLIKDPNIK